MSAVDPGKLVKLASSERSDSVARWKGVGLVLVAAISISVCLVLSRVVFDAGGSPLTVIGLRFAALVVALLIWSRLSGGLLRLPTRSLVACYLLGILFALHTGGFLASILYIPVSLAILTFYTYPLLTALFSALANRQLPGVVLMLCLPAALCGLGVAVNVELEGIELLGVGLAFGAAVAAAVVFTISERVMKDATSLSVTFHMAVVGAVLSAVLVVSALDTPTLPESTSGWLALAGALITFVAFFICLFAGIERIGAVPTAMIMNLEPVATVFLAILILHEHFAATQFAGAAIVIAAIMLVQYSTSQTEAE